MSSINREQVAAVWAKRGFSCDLWIDSPGQRWEDFTHSTDELVLVLEGKMEFKIAGRVCHPESGVELPMYPLFMRFGHEQVDHQPVVLLRSSCRRNSRVNSSYR